MSMPYHVRAKYTEQQLYITIYSISALFEVPKSVFHVQLQNQSSSVYTNHRFSYPGRILPMDNFIVEPKSRLDLKDLVFKRTSSLCQLEENNHRLPHHSATRKRLIVSVISWVALTMTFSSTAIFSATEEIASTFATTRGMLDLINALVFVLMSMTSFVWSPLSQVRFLTQLSTQQY